jgi:dinuclear metal center YbgI/SA1388 family protein
MKQISAKNLTDELNRFLDPDIISDKGPNGLQIINEGLITKIATAVTSDLKTIEKTVEYGAQALIVHHAFLDAYPITDQNLHKKIKLLVSNNIALLRYHLPLDAHKEVGNNWKAARDLGWQNLQPFGIINAKYFGVQGTLNNFYFEFFFYKIETYYKNKATVVAIKQEISSAAIISGAGYKFVHQATQAGVDCLITGSFDESAWYDAHELNVSFCALGHAATEKVGPKALAHYIAKTYGIESIFIDTQNPF